MFGFAGTPIFADNAVGMRTTCDLLGECLHRHVITDAIREVIRIRNALGSFSQFREVDLVLSPQEFEDFKSKHLDLAQRRGGGGDGGGTGGDDEPYEDPLAGMELIRRDEINVACILALLASLTIAQRSGGSGSRKAGEQRRRSLELLLSEPQLRNKRDLIEIFMDQKLPMLGPEDDVRAAFAQFWAEERARACSELCAKEDLDPEGVEKMVRATVFTGKRPLAGAIVDAMRVKPGILDRRSAVERAISGVERVISIFDEGSGDIED